MSMSIWSAIDFNHIDLHKLDILNYIISILCIKLHILCFKRNSFLSIVPRPHKTASLIIWAMPIARTSYTIKPHQFQMAIWFFINSRWFVEWQRFWPMSFTAKGEVFLPLNLMVNLVESWSHLNCNEGKSKQMVSSRGWPIDWWNRDKQVLLTDIVLSFHRQHTTCHIILSLSLSFNVLAVVLSYATNQPTNHPP